MEIKYKIQQILDKGVDEYTADRIAKLFIPEDRAEKVFYAIYQVTGVDIKENTNNRSHELVFLRYCFFDIVKGIYPKMSLTKLGDYLGKNHSSVIYALEQGLPSYLTIKENVKTYNEIKERVND